MTFPENDPYFCTPPGNIQEDDALELQFLDLGCEICTITLSECKREIITENNVLNFRWTQGKLAWTDRNRRFRWSFILTTTLTCLDRSLELRWRKSEKAAWGDKTKSHSHTHTPLKHTLILSDRNSAYPCIEHLVTEATVEFLGVGFCDGTQRHKWLWHYEKRMRMNRYIKILDISLNATHVRSQ